jgi:hypothetical protein
VQPPFKLFSVALSAAIFIMIGEDRNGLDIGRHHIGKRRQTPLARVTS